MVRTLLAALLLAAPAFAQDYGYGQYNGDDSWSQVDNEAPPPPEQGPSVDDFRNDSELSWNGNWVLTPEYGWVWVDTPHFMEPVRHHVVPQPRNIGNPAPTLGPRAGPAVAAVERAIGRTVRPMPVRDAPTPQAAQAGSSNPMFYRPRAVAPSGPRVREERPRGYYDATRNTPYARPAPAPAAGQNSGPRPAAAPSAAPAPAQPHATAPHATAPHAAPPSNAQQPKTQER